MGTPEFAVPSLSRLVDAGYDVVGVITATDKMGGRGRKILLQSAVKKYALMRGLKILQPKNLKSLAFQEELRSLNADFQVVVAFRMLPKAVWNMPPLGTMNLHGSLLPKYRGAAPIHWAVINGEKKTGVTTFLLKHEIDTGDILMQRAFKIEEHHTTGDVHDKMMYVGADLLLDSVRAIESGDFNTSPQDLELVSKAPKLHTEDCEIKNEMNLLQASNFVRGLNPFPGAWVRIQNKLMKVYYAYALPERHSHKPGTWITDNKNFLKLTFPDGYLSMCDVKLEGKRKMNIKELLNGYHFKQDDDIRIID
jgi:methionyl-tRNA formyltransferase